MAGITIDLPTFEADDLLDENNRRRLVSYLYRLAEQVKYLSTHIDEENITEACANQMVSRASAQLQDELNGTLTQFETQIDQNAREISSKASKTELNALGEEVDSVSSQLTQTASSLSARITSVKNTADGAEERVSSLELTLDGVVASIDNNRLSFTASGLTIKNAAGNIVFQQNNATGDLTLTGTINASGGNIGGFTIGEDSITGPNGVKLYSSGASSTVNNVWLGSGVDAFGNSYALMSQADGYDELRLGCVTGDEDSSGIRLYRSGNENRVSITYPLHTTAGVYLLNLPQISGVTANLYQDISGQIYRIV